MPKCAFYLTCILFAAKMKVLLHQTDKCDWALKEKHLVNDWIHIWSILSRLACRSQAVTSFCNTFKENLYCDNTWAGIFDFIFLKWLVPWLIRATILTDPEQACRSGVLTFPWVPKRSPCFWSAPQFTGVRGGQAAGLFRRSSVSISLFLSVHIFVNYMLHPEPTALFGLTNLIVEWYILNQAWHNQLVLVQPWNIFIREKNPALVHPK